MVYNIALSTVDSNGTIHSLYPKTKAKNVFTDKVINGRTNVEDILTDLNTRINQKVNNSELGAAALKNVTTTVGINSDSLITSGGVYNRIHGLENVLGSASRKQYTDVVTEDSDDLVTSRAVYRLFSSLSIEDLVLTSPIDNGSNMTNEFTWTYFTEGGKDIRVYTAAQSYNDYTQDEFNTFKPWLQAWSECSDLPVNYENYDMYKYIDVECHYSSRFNGSHGTGSSGTTYITATLMNPGLSDGVFKAISLRANGTTISNPSEYGLIYSGVDALLQLQMFHSCPGEYEDYEWSDLSVDSFRAYNK